MRMHGLTSWDGNNCVSDSVAKICLGSLFHPSEDHGADFFGGLLNANKLVVSRRSVRSTHKFTLLALILDTDAGMSVLIFDSERQVLQVLLDLLLLHLSTNETLGVKDRVFGIRVEGIFGTITDSVKNILRLELCRTGQKGLRRTISHLR